MSHLPAQHPTLSLHLADRALSPLLTSAQTSQHLALLTSLTNTSLNAYEAAQRLDLGLPQRIMVEQSNGISFLQSFLNPPPPQPSTSGDGSKEGRGGDKRRGNDYDNLGGYRDGSLTPTTTATKAYLRGGEATDSDASYANANANANANAKNKANMNMNMNMSHRDYEDNAYEHHYYDEDEYYEDENEDEIAPMFVGVVIAGAAGQATEARRAAARLERVGRQIQGRWVEMQAQEVLRPA